jgi:mannose-6-phosphate isomerase-like protein (cupin superfamily)
VGEVALSNPIAGERIKLRSAAADRLQIEVRARPGGLRPPLHLHRRSAESFEVIEGRMTLILDGSEEVLGPGDRREAPARTAHTWWNSGDGDLRFLCDFRPAGQMQSFFETLCGLAVDGRMDAAGQPAFLQIAASAPLWDTYLAGPPLLAQRALFFMLAPVAWAAGYRARYPRYEGSLIRTHEAAG